MSMRVVLADGEGNTAFEWNDGAVTRDGDTITVSLPKGWGLQLFGITITPIKKETPVSDRTEWKHSELLDEFEVLGFYDNSAIVRRKADGQRGEVIYLDGLYRNFTKKEV